MNKNDGGPAFPGNQAKVIIPDHLIKEAQVIQSPMNGMSLRDYYAGQAMQGMLASPKVDILEAITEPEYAAKVSYKIADAMIKERGDD